MREQQQLVQQPIISNSKILQKYKKRLLFQVIAIFSICLIVILQRIFYQVIVQSQEKVLAALQVNTDLVDKDSLGNITADQITNGFLKFLSTLSEFKLQFLMLTHFFITMYVSIDSYLTTKILYITMPVIYLVSLLQLFYGGSRPFWRSNQIMASSCLENYNHPSLGLVLSLFIPFYTYYCFKVKKGGRPGIKSTKEIIFFIATFILVALIQFINYFTGTIFIISITLSIVFFLLLIMVLFSMNNVIDMTIKKSTIIKVDAKKYTFYWLLFICLLETFVLIVYSGQDSFLDIDWVQNYINCTQYQNEGDVNYRYDQVIGPWFNFLQTAFIFGWIGAVFGISTCYRNITIPQWCETNTRKRIIRGVISNLLIIPSWLFVVLLEDGSWIKDIGLNQFIVDGIHFFILYLWLFGYMPVYVLQKGLKLTNKQHEDFYVVLQEKK